MYPFQCLEEKQTLKFISNLQFHLNSGLCFRDRVSSTSKDRSMYETLYAYCSFFVWIAFKRKEYEIVKRELGR